jgi:predicted nucleotidyltransferase
MRATSGLDNVARRFIEQKLDVIRREYSPEHLVVFGSRTNGTARAGSDIDLIIVSKKFRDISIPDRMGDFLNTVRPEVAVDAICYTPEEFDHLLQNQWPFVKNAVAAGIRVH